ncbi:MAG: hypothetical protein ACK56I_20590 [bacterium]
MASSPMRGPLRGGKIHSFRERAIRAPPRGRHCKDVRLTPAIGTCKRGDLR